MATAQHPTRRTAAPDAARPTTPGATVARLAVARIDPSPTNPRQTFDARELRELRASIEATGLLQPITVRPVQTDDGPRYEAVLGGRRLRAHRAFAADAFGSALPALDTVDALVRDLTDAEVIEAQLVENLQRADVPPLEEAAGFRRLLDAGASVAEAALRLGTSERHIRQRVQLTALIPDAAQAVTEGRLSIAGAIHLARISPEDQADVFGWWVRCIDHTGQGPSAGTIAQRISHHVMRQLARAPFDPTDATLVEGRPACGDCPQRTGFSASLFADIQEADTCTLPACFAAKSSAHVERVVQVQRAKAGQAKGATAGRAVVKVAGDYTPLPEGVLARDTVRELGPQEKNCAHVAVGVVATGHTVGRTVRVCVRGSGCATHWPAGKPRDDHVEREREKAKALKVQRVVLGRTLAATVDRLPVQEGTDPATGAPVVGVALDTLRMIAASMMGRLWSEYQKHVARAHGWAEPPSRWEPANGAVFGRHVYGHAAAIAAAIETMAAPALYRLLVEMALVEDAWPSPNAPTDAEPTRLLTLAATLGVDVAAIRSEAAESPARKAKTA